MGACATIGTTVNLFAPLFVKARSAYEAGDLPQALKYQHEINDRVEKTLKIGIFNAMKYGWTLRGIDCGRCRAPFKELTDEQKKIITEFFAGRS